VKIAKGEQYLYRGMFGSTYTITVLKPGRLRSVCMWGVHDVDFDYHFKKTAYRWNYRMIEL
jgi:hypothetical protein